jgi:predicted Rossmann-fold nucleotide-binding protein
VKIKQPTSLPKFPSGDAWAKAWQKHWSKVGMPDGLDALDERFEAATWIQCQKIGPFPLILRGSKFWKGLREWGQFMIKEGVFATEEIGFGYVTDSPKEAVDPLVRSLPLAVRKRLQPMK